MKRFSTFTKPQAEELAHALNKTWRAVLTVVILLLLGISIGFGWALWKISDTSDRADAANLRALASARAIAQLNKERSLDAQAQADKAARSAYVTCRRQQEQAPLTKEFLKITINPPLTEQEKEEIHKFYHILKAQNALSVPKCIKPPSLKGGS